MAGKATVALLVIDVRPIARGRVDWHASVLMMVPTGAMRLRWRQDSMAVRKGVFAIMEAVRALHDVSIQYGWVQDCRVVVVKVI